MGKINLSKVSVSVNSEYVAPKMLTSDWDEVNEHIEGIRQIAKKVSRRVKVYQHYRTVHLAEYVREELIGKIFKLACSSKEIYLGTVCKWSVEYDSGRGVTCKRCLKRLGKHTEVEI